MPDESVPVQIHFDVKMRVGIFKDISNPDLPDEYVLAQIAAALDNGDAKVLVIEQVAVERELTVEDLDATLPDVTAEDRWDKDGTF